MNWYKKAQQDSTLQEYPSYGHIGHYYGRDRKKFENPTKRVFLWAAYADGTNFHKEELRGEKDSYDHSGLLYDFETDISRGVFQGRYDESKNIVSVYHNKSIFSMYRLPNRLLDRLKQEFGQNIIIILDYSSEKPERII